MGPSSADSASSTPLQNRKPSSPGRDGLLGAERVRVVGEPLGHVGGRPEADRLQDERGVGLLLGLHHLARSEATGDVGLTRIERGDDAGVVGRHQGLDLDATQTLGQHGGQRLGSLDEPTRLLRGRQREHQRLGPVVTGDDLAHGAGRRRLGLRLGRRRRGLRLSLRRRRRGLRLSLRRRRRGLRLRLRSPPSSPPTPPGSVAAVVASVAAVVVSDPASVAAVVTSDSPRSPPSWPPTRPRSPAVVTSVGWRHRPRRRHRLRRRARAQPWPRSLDWSSISSVLHVFVHTVWSAQ